MQVLKLSFLAIAMAVTGYTTYAQTADEIIQKHIEAVGGTKIWDNIKSVKLKGAMSAQGMEIDMTQTIVENKGMRVDINAMGQAGYTIITPTEGWMYMPFMGQTKPEALPADQLKSQQSKISFRNNMLVDKSQITKSSLAGKDVVNKIACYKLKVTDKDGGEQTCFIDQTTYFLVRTEMKIKLQDDDQDVAVNYSDFKKQPEGITVPMTYGTPQGDLKYKSIEINKTVDEAIFKPTN